MKKITPKPMEVCAEEVFSALKPYNNLDARSKAVNLQEDPDVLFGIMQAIPDILLVIDMRTNGYVYINNAEVLGYQSQEFIDGGMARALRMFPETHGRIITQHIFPVMFRHFEEQCRAGSFREINASYPTQLIHRDGTHRWFRHTIRILSTDDQQKPLLLLKILSDIDDIKKDACMDFTITRTSVHKKTEVLFKERYLPEVSQSILSERENQVLSLISMGYTSSMIAEKLFISQHTVRTHRKNILRKTFCKGTAELAAFALNGNASEQ